jgi:hypothetical protein
MQKHVILVSVSLLLAGCGKKENETTPPQANAPTAPPSSFAERPSTSVVDAVEEMAAKTREAAEAAAEKVQALLDEAKGMLSQNDLAGASQVLGKLGEMTLTEEQQAQLTALKGEFTEDFNQVETGLSELKTMVAEKRYSDAAALISKLSEYRLGPEQQRTFDALKEQAQNLVGDQAVEKGAEALQDLLGR